MDATRKRRIVRRAVMALAGVVLLPVWYVCSVAALVAGANTGTLPPILFETPLPNLYIAPLRAYIESDMPGAESINAMMERTQRHASRLRSR